MRTPCLIIKYGAAGQLFATVCVPYSVFTVLKGAFPIWLGQGHDWRNVESILHDGFCMVSLHDRGERLSYPADDGMAGKSFGNVPDVGHLGLMA